ncbi:hypothetical protein ACFCXA_26500 [Streptomyces virginiae]|uniref:hypothetical protein n=1 Tax=Streptomyces virginiae TaxID=1961 RepID=UPI0035DC7958
MQRQYLARLEEQALGPSRHLDEVSDPAWLATDLDDVAALDADRGDLDAGGVCTSGGSPSHWFACRGSGASSATWQEQAQAS